jgi:hypothetical protein
MKNNLVQKNLLALYHLYLQHCPLNFVVNKDGITKGHKKASLKERFTKN